MSDHDGDEGDGDSATSLGAPLFIVFVLLLLYMCFHIMAASSRCNSTNNMYRFCCCIDSRHLDSVTAETSSNNEEVGVDGQNRRQRQNGVDDTNDQEAGDNRIIWISKEERRFDIECQLYTRRYIKKKPNPNKKQPAKKVAEGTNSKDLAGKTDNCCIPSNATFPTTKKFVSKHNYDDDEEFSEEEEENSTDIHDIEEGQQQQQQRERDDSNSSSSEHPPSMTTSIVFNTMSSSHSDDSSNTITQSHQRGRTKSLESLTSASVSSTMHLGTNSSHSSINIDNSSNNGLFSAISKNVQSWLDDMNTTSASGDENEFKQNGNKKDYKSYDCNGNVTSCNNNRSQNYMHVCLICLCEYEHNDEVSWSPNPDCTHEFHTSCIVDWLSSPKNKSQCCPVCRRPYLLQEEEGELPGILSSREENYNSDSENSIVRPL